MQPTDGECPCRRAATAARVRACSRSRRHCCPGSRNSTTESSHRSCTPFGHGPDASQLPPQPDCAAHPSVDTARPNGKPSLVLPEVLVAEEAALSQESARVEVDPLAHDAVAVELEDGGHATAEGPSRRVEAGERSEVGAEKVELDD